MPCQVLPALSPRFLAAQTFSWASPHGDTQMTQNYASTAGSHFAPGVSHISGGTTYHDAPVTPAVCQNAC